MSRPAQELLQLAQERIEELRGDTKEELLNTLRLAVAMSEGEGTVLRSQSRIAGPQGDPSTTSEPLLRLDTLIHLRLDYLIDIMKPLADHRFRNDLFQQQRWQDFDLWQKGGEATLPEQVFYQSLHTYATCGQLPGRVFEFLVSKAELQYGLNPMDVYNLLSERGVVYEANPTSAARVSVPELIEVTVRLPSEANQPFRDMLWSEADHSFTGVARTATTHSVLPPALTEKLVVGTDTHMVSCCFEML